MSRMRCSSERGVSGEIEIQNPMIRTHTHAHIECHKVKHIFAFNDERLE